MKSRVEKCIVVSRLNGVNSAKFHANEENVTVNMYGYLVVPLENIKGLEDSIYMSMDEISKKLKEIGSVVEVGLSGARKND
jgi:hypothetical protein